VSEVVDINIERRIVVGYNDVFTALAIARGFRGDRGVYKDRELYIRDFDLLLMPSKLILKLFINTCRRR
jgi:hypothetical protein